MSAAHVDPSGLLGLPSGLSDSVVEQVVAGVFATLVGTAAGVAQRPVADGGALDVSARISMTGAWSGRIVLICSAALARRFAARMALRDEPQVSAADVRDAVGELVNAVGGNLKALLPGPTWLALPRVRFDSREQHHPGVQVLRLELAWHDEPLVVSVHTTSVRRT